MRPLGLLRDLKPIALAFGLAAGLTSLQALAADNRPLQLEVFINGHPTRLIGTFVQQADNRIAATRAELEEIGLKVNPGIPAERNVVLNDLPQVSYRYDELGQKLDITADHSALRPRSYDLSTPPQKPVAPRADWGALLNYSLFGTSGSVLKGSILSGAGTSASLEARVFSPLGTIEQSAITRYGNGTGAELLRLDTSYRYSDPAGWFPTGSATASAVPCHGHVRSVSREDRPKAISRSALISSHCPCRSSVEQRRFPPPLMSTSTTSEPSPGCGSRPLHHQ